MFPNSFASERRMLIKPCICGGRVRADRTAPAAGMVTHHQTTVHRLWRLARARAGEPAETIARLSNAEAGL